MDTPGYTYLDIDRIEGYHLSFLFRDFRAFLGKCRFNDCIHSKEPDCAVRQAVEEGLIQQRRYQSYLEILDEIRNPRR